MITYSFSLKDAADYGINVAVVMNILNQFILQDIALNEIKKIEGKTQSTGVNITSLELNAMLPFMKPREIAEALDKAKSIFEKRGHLFFITKSDKEKQQIEELINTQPKEYN